jgi:hypothetical protein
MLYTRGIQMSCSGETPAIDRVMDAYGGLAFLVGLPFVDPERIAVVAAAPMRSWSSTGTPITASTAEACATTRAARL